MRAPLMHRALDGQLLNDFSEFKHSTFAVAGLEEQTGKQPARRRCRGRLAHFMEIPGPRPPKNHLTVAAGHHWGSVGTAGAGIADTCTGAPGPHFLVGSCPTGPRPGGVHVWLGWQVHS